MKNLWKLQDAKNRLSHLVRKARQSEPQIITLHGKEAAVLLSIEDYNRLTRSGSGLVDFFKSSPLRGVELDLERSRDTGRDAAHVVISW